MHVFGLYLAHTGEKIMLDAIDSMHNGGKKSQDLNLKSLLTRW